MYTVSEKMNPLLPGSFFFLVSVMAFRSVSIGGSGGSCKLRGFSSPIEVLFHSSKSCPELGALASETNLEPDSLEIRRCNG